ncbi:hypothetical protein SBA3_1820068 [Candidatus Sulfopaludibacter sp. SbA3]|nr:hypothetical protein SBA3_1820068 [Candidatus Sulfopaludibacter sp. SbA3]
MVTEMAAVAHPQGVQIDFPAARQPLVRSWREFLEDYARRLPGVAARLSQDQLDKAHTDVIQERLRYPARD